MSEPLYLILNESLSSFIRRLPNRDLSGVEEILAMIMEYIRFDVETNKAKHVALQSDRSLRFSRIPRDIRNMLCDYVPIVHATAFEPQLIHMGFDANDSLLGFTRLDEGEPLPDTPGFQLLRFQNGVLHSDLYPACIKKMQIHRRISWFSGGIPNSDCGYHSRYWCGGNTIYILDSVANPVRDLICSNYDVDCQHHSANSRSREEWEDLWNNIRDNDPWPLDDPAA